MNENNKKVRVNNPIIVKIVIIFIVAIVTTGIILLSYHVLKNGTSSNIYNLGERDSSEKYEDAVLKTYEDYKKLMGKYHLDTSLKEKDFDNNSYVASFQEYDSCSESKYKKVVKVAYDEGIIISFDVYNKCGLCKTKIVLYIIKIEKNPINDNINYIYNYRNKKECGNIS